MVYRCAKQRSEPSSDKRGAKVDELHLTPLELIDRIAALAPQPRTHRHRYFGVLAPNSPLRASVTAMAAPAQAASAQAEQPARVGVQYWSTSGWTPSRPRIAPGRGPPLWDDCDARVGEGVEVAPDWDPAAQPAPDFDVDQRINW